MKTAVVSTKPYDRSFLEAANESYGHKLTFFEYRLTPETAGLASGFPAICAFVNDDLNAGVLAVLAEHDTRLVALRAAGFNNVDVASARDVGIAVAHVPAYSPYAVAEHACGMLLTLSRKFHRAYHRVREGNFALDGLLGFDIHGGTIGIVGTGRIGLAFAGIMKGFGCRLLAYDPYPNDEVRRLGIEYVPLETLFGESDFVSLHCPLTPETYHIIDANALEQMKPGGRTAENDVWT